MPNVNPFAEVFETKTYPHARTLRTSFIEKLQDSYYTIAGTTTSKKDKPHLGIFDYLTLGIPVLSDALTGWCDRNADKNFLAKVLFIPAAIIWSALLVTRVVFSAAATILFSPVTAIVHGFSRLFAKQSLNEALNLEGETKAGKRSLAQYLQEENENIEAPLVVVLNKKPAKKGSDKGPYPFQAQADRYQLKFWRNLKALEECEEDCRGSCDKDHAPFSVEISEDETGTVKQAKNIHALFRLNACGVVNEIEKDRNRLFNDREEKRQILAI